MRVVVDTNVLVSGLFWSGTPAKIFDLWQQRKVIPCVNDDILDEYLRVTLEMSIQRPASDANQYLRSLIHYMEIHPNTYLPSPASRDPDDDKFLACALEAKAKVIVSGDKDLLDLKSYSGVEIVAAKCFVEKYSL